LPRARKPQDLIPMELIKLINEENIETILKLSFNRIYSTHQRNIKEWLISTFVTIPKKQGPKKCAD